MSQIDMSFGIPISVPHATDLTHLETLERLADEAQIGFPRPVGATCVAEFVSKLALGQADVINAMLRQDFLAYLPPGWENTADAKQVKAWHREAEELARDVVLHVPPEKASVNQREQIIATALQEARSARTQVLKALVREMPRSALDNGTSWIQYASERVRPCDARVRDLLSLEKALDRLGPPDNSERASALSHIAIAKDRIEAVHRQIQEFWQTQFAEFEVHVRTSLGLTPLKKGARTRATAKH